VQILVTLAHKIAIIIARHSRPITKVGR